MQYVVKFRFAGSLSEDRVTVDADHHEDAILKVMDSRLCSENVVTAISAERLETLEERVEELLRLDASDAVEDEEETA